MPRPAASIDAPAGVHALLQTSQTTPIHLALCRQLQVALHWGHEEQHAQARCRARLFLSRCSLDRACVFMTLPHAHQLVAAEKGRIVALQLCGKRVAAGVPARPLPHRNESSKQPCAEAGELLPANAPATSFLHGCGCIPPLLARQCTSRRQSSPPPLLPPARHPMPPVDCAACTLPCPRSTQSYEKFPSIGRRAAGRRSSSATASLLRLAALGA